MNDSILLTFREGSVHAVVVDPRTLRPRGESVVISGSASLQNLFLFAAAPSGVVTFVIGNSTIDAELVLVERSGQAHAALPQRQAYRYPRFSSDGNRLVFGVSGVDGPPSGDIWILNLRDGKTLRVTSDGMSYHPEWMPDGMSIRHLHRDSTSTGTVYSSKADGTSPASPFFTGVTGNWEHVLAPGNRLILRRDNATTGRDISLVELDGGKVMPLVASQFDEKGLALSPDGTWLAYSSDEAGTHDVYIRRVEPGSARWRVSVGGGVEPRWAKTGEIFFRRGDSVFVSRVRTTGAEPTISALEFVLSGDYVGTTFEPMYDVSPDGKRFAFVRLLTGSRLRTAVLLNWQGLLQSSVRR